MLVPESEQVETKERTIYVAMPITLRPGREDLYTSISRTYCQRGKRASTSFYRRPSEIEIWFGHSS